MIYIISEDSEAGCEFWVKVGEVFNLSLKVIPCFGIDKMVGMLSAYRKNGFLEFTYKDLTCKTEFSDASCIVLLSDMFGTKKHSNTSKTYRSVTESGIFIHDKLQNCPVFISNYGSFEAVLLTFTKLVKWVHPPTNHRRNHEEWKFIVDSLITLKAYKVFGLHYINNTFRGIFFEPGSAEYSNSDVWEFFLQREQRDNIHKNTKNAVTTHEKLCTALLKHLTWGTDFITDKSKVGTGWINDCQDYCEPLGEFEKYGCQNSHLTSAQLGELGWSENDIYDSELACRNMTARKKLLTLFENSDFNHCFKNVVDVSNGIQHFYSIKDVLGISHLHAADEPNNPADACSTCRLRESPAYKDQETEQQPLLDVNQLPPPEPLPDTTPQWNQRQPNNAPAQSMRGQALMQALAPETVTPVKSKQVSSSSMFIWEGVLQGGEDGTLWFMHNKGEVQLFPGDNVSISDGSRIVQLRVQIVSGYWVLQDQGGQIIKITNGMQAFINRR